VIVPLVGLTETADFRHFLLTNYLGLNLIGLIQHGAKNVEYCHEAVAYRFITISCEMKSFQYFENLVTTTPTPIIPTASVALWGYRIGDP